MKQYDKIRKLNINLCSLGLEQHNNEVTYYCTPKWAKIIGWAGVDGIHYCTIPQFGEMIFAVSPMNLGDCVHPIARNFEDLLRLLLSGANMAALEQCYAWDEEQFQAFLLECPIMEEQQAALDKIQQTFALEPMDDVFHYVKTLQAEFDLSQIPYTEDYYDPDMNAAAPERDEKWGVYFDRGFFEKGSGSGRAGKEAAINACFAWGNELWHIPAVYVCGKGLVVDFCIEIDPEREIAFLEKWEPIKIQEERLTRELQNQINQENPLHVEFCPCITVNGKRLTTKSGSGISWIPTSCLPEDQQNDRQARRMIEHYGLDETKVWLFHRQTYLWATRKKPTIKSIHLKLERERTQMEGVHFHNPSVGDNIFFTHPVWKSEHKLTVLNYEQQRLSSKIFASDKYEFPTHHTVMTFALEPELPNGTVQIRDCLSNDVPKRRPANVYEPQADVACAIGIIGGADGPTAIMITNKNDGTKTGHHIVCSALHFEPQSDVEWEMVFYEKTVEDIEIALLC